MMYVSAGLPGKIRVVINGVEYSLDHTQSLYTGLHELAARVNQTESESDLQPSRASQGGEVTQ